MSIFFYILTFASKESEGRKNEEKENGRTIEKDTLCNVVHIKLNQKQNKNRILNYLRN